MKRPANVLNAILIDERHELTVSEFCSVCGLSADRLHEMIEEGLVEPRGRNANEWRFGGGAVRRVQIAVRLQHDLHVNLAGAALALDLLDELERLRRFEQRRGNLG